MSESSSPKPSAPIRARRWSRSQPPRAPAPPYRFMLRLIGIPAVAVAGVLIYGGLRDRFVLPECDSSRAKRTLADVLKELKLEPMRDGSIKTVSSSKEQVVCSALLPSPEGAVIAVDYTFYWDGSTAKMKYSISRKSS
jgi:hypothetical protein